MLSQNAISVTVIITTKNEEGNLENCLKSVNKQNYPAEKIEIIVVDNNSNDRTKEIASRYTDKIYNFGPNRAAQLNFGVNLARGAYILFPDADMILSANLLQECAQACSKRDLIALYIPERITGRGFWIKVRDFERSFYTATCIDAVRFVRKDQFLQVGGFDQDLDFGPDDWDFDRRIKQTGPTGIIPAPLYHNEGELNLNKYLKKKSSYYSSFAKYIQKWGKDDKIIKKQFGFWYRYLGVYIESGKWRMFLRHPGLVLGMYLSRILLGVQYLKHRRLKR